MGSLPYGRIVSRWGAEDACPQEARVELDPRHGDRKKVTAVRQGEPPGLAFAGISFRNRSADRKTPPCGGEILNPMVELNRIELSAS
jgi:hypothetical protein